jgi:hypothetical protein
MAAPKKPAPKIKPVKNPYPSARAGNYRAPVDTTGMDPEMMNTLGIKRKKQKP